ncbi:MAG: glycosyltransferase family 4 protein [Chloroflexi bacterium]|nr:glycosyltransferase family 4 protein [Chloroflexota bacterium]
MHIALNAHLMQIGRSYRFAGVGKFLAALLVHLQAADPENRYTVFTGPLPPEAHLPAQENFRFVATRYSTASPLRRILWEQLAQPVELLRRGVDVLHAPVNVLPLACPCPAVLTIHDLSFLVYPDRLPRARQRYLTLLTRWSAQRARLVLTVSAHTRQDVVRLLGVPEERVRVVYPGVDPALGPARPQAVAEFRRRRGLPDRFILYLGTLEPRKNLPTLIRAYDRLRRAGCDHALVLAGGRGWMDDDIFRLVDDLDLGDRVCFPGYVPEEELALWYSAADLLVYPSVYEGFGLPPLEAMACGTPVIVADRSSLPEVVGDAGITFPPERADALADAIAEALADPARREALRAAGLCRAQQFSWSRTAQGVFAAYREVGGGA